MRQDASYATGYFKMKKFSFHYVMRHVGTLLVTCLAIFALFYAIGTFAPDLLTSIPPGSEVGLIVVLLFLPPMMTARAFYKHELRPMRSGEGWLLAIACTLGGFLALAMLVVGANTALYGTAAGQGEVGALLNDVTGLVIFAAILCVVVLLINRLFFWATIKGEMKKAAKL